MGDQSAPNYVLPRHPTEVDRLDVQHYAMREALAANYLAPIERPERILDVGWGTGQWAYELCQQFPEAIVVGLDLEPSKPERPANYRFIKADLLKGLPFPRRSLRLRTSAPPAVGCAAEALVECGARPHAGDLPGRLDRAGRTQG